MKQSGVCTKCGNKEIEGPFIRTHGIAGGGIILSGKQSKSILPKKPRLEVYICYQCGFVEEYIREIDLLKVKK